MQNLGHRNSIAVKGQEKIDAIKDQTLFLVKVKSQGPFIFLTMVAARLEYRVYVCATLLCISFMCSLASIVAT